MIFVNAICSGLSDLSGLNGLRDLSGLNGLRDLSDKMKLVASITSEAMEVDRCMYLLFWEVCRKIESP